MRVQGWDPVLLICQIIALQTIHYLTLGILIPPMLHSFTSSPILTYAGGASTVGHILDWRELAARPTISSSAFGDVDWTDPAAGWRKLRGAWAGGKQIGEVEDDTIGSGVKEGQSAEEEEEVWDFGVDDRRGWLLGLCWLIASGIDIAPLYYIIRRPTHILDFSLTLNFIHLILTTYYAASFPTSLFYWVIQALGALMMIVVGEQVCVRRELHTGLDFGWQPDLEPGQRSEEQIELVRR